MLKEALRLIRVYHDMKQFELADKMGVSKSHISGVETGKNTPSYELIEKYSEVFDIPVSSIIFFAEQIEKPDGSIKEADGLQKFIAGKVIKFLSLIEEKATIA